MVCGFERLLMGQLLNLSSDPEIQAPSELEVLFFLRLRSATNIWSSCRGIISR